MIDKKTLHRYRKIKKFGASLAQISKIGFDSPAQRRPDEASPRLLQEGAPSQCQAERGREERPTGVPSFEPGDSGSPAIPPGESLPPASGRGGGLGGGVDLGSYRLSHTPANSIQNLRYLIRQISKDTTLRPYLNTVKEFVFFLNQMDKACFIISGFDQSKNKAVEKTGLFVTRWTQIYRKRTLARLYMLDGWWEENKTPVTMMTLTTYQGGEYSRSVKGKIVTIDESFRLLKDGWDKLSKILRKYVPDLTYIWIVEPHASGYPHLHIVIFNDIPEDIQEKIRHLWAEKYQTGSKEHGVEFTTKSTEKDIRSLRCYLMKYIAKGFVSTGSRYIDVTWTKEELVYNAVVWKNGYRTFQPSNNLQYVMGMDKEKKNPAVWWHTAEAETEHYATKERQRTVMFVRPMVPDWIPFRDGSESIYYI